jgi:large subunit ribosomal protein L19
MTTDTLQFAPKAVQNRKDMDLRAGDTVRVYVKIEEKGKVRSQMFQGLVLATKHGKEPGATFTVRKISNGVGVERIFPLYSPAIDKIEVIKRSNTRRSKLYYLRDKVAREVRRKMRNFVEYLGSTEDLDTIQDEALAEEPDVVEEETEVKEAEVSTEENTETPSEETPEEDADEDKKEKNEKGEGNEEKDETKDEDGAKEE